MIVAVIMNHFATPKSTHCTVLTCNINIDNDYLQSINNFSYSITRYIFSTGDATISNKLLKTKICAESLTFLLLKLSLEGFSLSIISNRFLVCYGFLLCTAFQFCLKETKVC